MYYYESPIGLFRIIQQDSNVLLFFEDDLLGAYRSAVAAANDVYTHTTGLYDWDKLDGKLLDVPTDISEWTLS